jgi:hypothetical protein
MMTRIKNKINSQKAQERRLKEKGRVYREDTTMTTKTFDLGTVLTVTTGRLLTDIGNVYNILDFMTNDNLMTHQLPRASNACTKPLLAQFPQLNEVEVPESFEGEDHDPHAAVKNWLDTQKVIYGNAFEVEPLESFEHKNPLTELADMRPDMPIVVVAPKGKST